MGILEVGMEQNLFQPERLSSAGSNPEVQLTPNESNCEKTILYLLKQPNFKTHHLGDFTLRERLDLKVDEWLQVARELVSNSKIMKLEKSNPNAARPDTVALDLEVIATAEGIPYLTSSIFSEIEIQLAKLDPPPTN